MALAVARHITNKNGSPPRPFPDGDARADRTGPLYLASFADRHRPQPLHTTATVPRVCPGAWPGVGAYRRGIDIVKTHNRYYTNTEVDISTVSTAETPLSPVPIMQIMHTRQNHRPADVSGQLTVHVEAWPLNPAKRTRAIIKASHVASKHQGSTIEYQTSRHSRSCTPMLAVQGAEHDVASMS